MLRSLPDQRVHLTAMLIQPLNRDLKRIGELFHKDLHGSGHPGADIFGWIENLNERRVLLDRGTHPAPRFRIAVDLRNPTPEPESGDRVDRNFDRHPIANESHLRLVDLTTDLHPGGVRKSDNRLTFSNQSPRLDNKFRTSAPTAITIRMHDDSIGGSGHHAIHDLLLAVSHLCTPFRQLTRGSTQARNGRLDIAVVLNEHFLEC